MDGVVGFLGSINDALMSVATNYEGTWLLFLFLWLFITLDGILPIFPSESLVIAVVAISVSTGSPALWLVAVVAVVGAMGGDITTYLIGRRAQVHQWRLLKFQRIARVLDWAERMVARKPATVIVAARYIPGGRVAVNFTAGRMVFPMKAFVFFDAIAAVTWAIYSCLIGLGAGAWLKGHPVYAVMIGVTGGVLIGFVVDAVLRRILARRGTALKSMEGYVPPHVPEVQPAFEQPPTSS